MAPKDFIKLNLQRGDTFIVTISKTYLNETEKEAPQICFNKKGQKGWIPLVSFKGTYGGGQNDMKGNPPTEVRICILEPVKIGEAPNSCTAFPVEYITEITSIVRKAVSVPLDYE